MTRGVNFEQYRDSEDIPSSVPVPDADARADIIQGLSGSGACTATVVNPNASVGTQASHSLMNFYPNPSGGVANLFPGTSCPNGTQQVSINSPQRISDNFYLGRIEHQISDKQSVFGRYLIQTGVRIIDQAPSRLKSSVED